MLSELSSELDRYFAERSSRELFAGVVLLTNSAGTLYEGAFGLASRAWRIPNRLDYRFDTASITKLFTAVAALQLIDRELFSLDTSVVDYLSLKNTTISPDVTVFHLLTHTSGIADDCEEENGEDYAESWQSEPCYAVSRAADFLPRFIHKPPNFAPGQGCRYCNCSFILLGLMIEQASGGTYRDYIRRLVFQPAGMVDSDFLHMGYANERLAEGSDPVANMTGEITGYKRNIYSFPPIGTPDSGAHVTAGDLDLFFRKLKAGRLLSQERTRAFFQPCAFHSDHGIWQLHYGYVLAFYLDSQGQVIYCQKEGYNAGASGVIRHYPDQDVNIVILSNMAEGAWPPMEYLHSLVWNERYRKCLGST